MRAVAAAAAAGDAGQSGLHRAAVRSGDPAGHPRAADQHGRPLLLPQRRQRDHRADGARHRQGRPRRSGVDRFRDLAVGRVVGHLVVRRLDRRGPRPDAAAPPGAAAVLRARPLRGDARRRDRGGTIRRARTAQDRRAPPGQLGQRAGVRLLPGAVPHPVRRGQHPLPGRAAQAAAVASAGVRGSCWRRWCS